MYKATLKQRKANRKATVKWRAKNIERVRAYKKRYNAENKEKNADGHRQWIAKNKEHRIEYMRMWQKEHRLIRNEYNRNRLAKLRKENPQYRIEQSFANAIRKALHGKKSGRKWETLVDYTLHDLVQHLESLFDENMSWNNYGSYWHIDHIKPKSLFKYQCAEDPEFKECWSLNNLQPLEASENLRKHNKYEGGDADE